MIINPVCRCGEPFRWHLNPEYRAANDLHPEHRKAGRCLAVACKCRSYRPKVKTESRAGAA